MAIKISHRKWTEHISERTQIYQYESPQRTREHKQKHKGQNNESNSLTMSLEVMGTKPCETNEQHEQRLHSDTMKLKDDEGITTHKPRLLTKNDRRSYCIPCLYYRPFNNHVIREKALWKQSHFMTIIGTLFISKLFTSFVPICSQCRLYICYLGESVKNKTHRFQCFSANDVIY